MTEKEQIAQIKKRVKVLHLAVILLLVVNAIVWFSLLFKYYHSDYLWIAGLSCVGFMIAVVLVCFFIEKHIKRNLKNFVGKLFGIVADEDKQNAAALLKKWKKHYIRSMKLLYPQFRKETYPFGMQIVEDLGIIKKGIKIERPFYFMLMNQDFGEEANQLLLEISTLIGNNSYIYQTE